MFGAMGKIKLQSVLQSLIQDKGVSARQISKATGIAQSTLSNYLQGKGIQKPEHLVTLAEYFSTSIDFLLTGKDKRSPSLEEAFTEGLFDGYLKVKIERVVPTKRKGEDS